MDHQRLLYPSKGTMGVQSVSMQTFSSSCMQYDAAPMPHMDSISKHLLVDTLLPDSIAKLHCLHMKLCSIYVASQ